MVRKLNKEEKLLQRLMRFHTWIKERGCAADWVNYVRGSKLIRCHIARDCGFASSTLRQHSVFQTELEFLEARLRLEGRLGNAFDQRHSEKHFPSHFGSKNNSRNSASALGDKAALHTKQLEDQNRALKKDIAQLQSQLKNYKFITDHIFKTGRTLQ